MSYEIFSRGKAGNPRAHSPPCAHNGRAALPFLISMLVREARRCAGGQRPLESLTRQPGEFAVARVVKERAQLRPRPRGLGLTIPQRRMPDFRAAVHVPDIRCVVALLGFILATYTATGRATSPAACFGPGCFIPRLAVGQGKRKPHSGLGEASLLEGGA